MFNKKTIRDIDVSNKRLLVRVDFNVPIENGKVADDTRIRSALPTLNYLLDQNAALILCSHLGRPKGKPDPIFSLRPVAELLSSIVDAPVTFVENYFGGKIDNRLLQIRAGEIVLLENTRFHDGEKANDPDFAKALASYADIFVDDAFGTAHRAHASNVGVADFLPAVAGFLLEKEIKYLGQAIESPTRPLVAILGGAKVSDKIGVINRLLQKADTILIGGGMANTFFKAQGYPIGDSLVENDVLDVARQLLKDGAEKIRLPVDVVIADGFKADAKARTINMGPIPEGWMILDVGPETLDRYSNVVDSAGTIVWNGPMGVFEFPQFAKGTFDLAKAVAESQAVSIIGGGESVAAINRSGLADDVTHISTGGGASLEMLEGKILPGLAALNDI
jgi:phosphoglycerate kinase